MVRVIGASHEQRGVETIVGGAVVSGATRGLVAVPGLFWADHEDRAPLNPGEQLAEPVGRRGRSVLIRQDDPGLEVLLSDARYYADPESMDDCPPSVRASAQRTVATLERSLSWTK